MRAHKQIDLNLVRRLCAAGETAAAILRALHDAGMSCCATTLQRRMREANLTTRQIRAEGEALLGAPRGGVVYPEVDPWPASAKF